LGHSYDLRSEGFGFVEGIEQTREEGKRGQGKRETERIDQTGKRGAEKMRQQRGGGCRALSSFIKPKLLLPPLIISH
jgi:hypothetical protein